jgi:hypothetical protein
MTRPNNAKPMISTAAAPTALSAARVTSAGSRPRVSATKIGALPGGSVMTSSVTSVSPSTRQSVR